jgi:hypothetical protein
MTTPKTLSTASPPQGGARSARGGPALARGSFDNQGAPYGW